MSYTIPYSVNVPYSGSETVSYPASEHGGVKTVHYSGHVRVDVNINVQTHEFDRSVGDVRGSLNLVAGALAAAETAQVAQVYESGEQISNTAINGFFRILANELSTKISEFSSSMKSVVGLLVEEGKRVDYIHQQMEGDYQSIKGRYLRIFDELDRELARRIKELDTLAFRLSRRSMQGMIVGPFLESAPRALVQAADIDSTVLKLNCATSKKRVVSSLSTLGDVCTYISDYDDAVEKIMTEDEDEGIMCMPVVYALQDDLESATQRIVVHKADDLPDDVKRGVIRYVATADVYELQDANADSRVAHEFMNLVDHYSTGLSESKDAAHDERVRQTMVELFRTSEQRVSQGR